MTDLTQKQTKEIIQAGIELNQIDRGIAWLVIFGMICFPFWPASGFVGFPLLAGSIWARKGLANKQH